MGLEWLDLDTPIDAFAPLVDGAYVDPVVTVRRVGRRDRRGRGIHTTSFDLHNRDARLEVRHCLPPEELSNTLSVRLASELFETGWLRGSTLFERIFTGIVRSFAEDPLDSWELFYRNTMAGRPTPPPGGGEDATLGPVHDHLHALLTEDTIGSVLDLASCFGFLPLELSARGFDVTATDADADIVELLAAVADRLRSELRVDRVDARRLPYRDDAFDTVLALHLLEHLPPEDGESVLEQVIRVATRRAIIAVPFEDEPNESYGHLRTIALSDLHRWGERSGLPYHAYEHHGGWLIIDCGRS